jgi:hypothetical protein
LLGSLGEKEQAFVRHADAMHVACRAILHIVRHRSAHVKVSHHTDTNTDMID